MLHHSKFGGRLAVTGQSLPNCDVRTTSVYPSISDMAMRRRERRKGRVARRNLTPGRSQIRA